MGELVEKKEVIDTMIKMVISGECCVGTDPRSKHMGKLAMLKAIDKVKGINGRKGEWKIDGRHKICSECGVNNYSKYKAFCPNCGAAMIKSEE